MTGIIDQVGAPKRMMQEEAESLNHLAGLGDGGSLDGNAGLRSSLFAMKRAPGVQVAGHGLGADIPNTPSLGS